jgi:Zinc finger, ZZ type
VLSKPESGIGYMRVADNASYSCLLDIVGARFHCAICDSVDICANCESAGLPGNLDSADGGHNSSHILIKVNLLLFRYGSIS